MAKRREVTEDEMTKTLTERYIQEAALDFLKNYYRKCSHNNQIEARLEATTQKLKRADGLLVWEQAPNKVRVVSIEAKSAKTVRSLQTRWDQERLSNSSFYAAEFLFFIIFCALYSVGGLRLPFEPALLIVLLIALPILWKGMRPFIQKIVPPLFQTAGVLEQATRYPGNEVWIAIGSDTFKKDKEERLTALQYQCKRRKYGLLEIQADETRPVILLEPQFKYAPTKDFLSFYKHEAIIRTNITGDTQRITSWWRRSKAERKHELKQFKWAGLFTLCLPFFYLYNTYTSGFSSPLAADVPDIVDTKPLAKATVFPRTTTVDNSPADCSMPFEGRKYILKDQVVPTLEAAQERVQALLEAGCSTANYFWIPCSNEASGAYAWCVYVNTPQNHLHTMEEELRQYQQLLGRAGLRFAEGDIWYVESEE